VAETDLILASTSAYRAALLARLRQRFSTAAPRVDEAPRPGESAERLCLRLARAKAEAVAVSHPLARVIGSDQVAECDDQLLGKPGTPARALTQLRLLSGRCARFHTGVALIHNGECLHGVHTTTVWMRALSDAELRRYIEAEPALDCAGSFKCEGYGISLFERIESDDPTGLEGLPLILTARLLRKSGLALP
jgi:septum formation protein